MTLDSGITLPGFSVGKPSMLITENIYPTNFGDVSEPNYEAFLRDDRIWFASIIGAYLAAIVMIGWTTLA